MRKSGRESKRLKNTNLCLPGDKTGTSIVILQLYWSDTWREGER